jgi:hypothetical protein
MCGSPGPTPAANFRFVGSTGSLSRASTPQTHSWTRHRGSFWTAYKRRVLASRRHIRSPDLVVLEGRRVFQQPQAISPTTFSNTYSPRIFSYSIGIAGPNVPGSDLPSIHALSAQHNEGLCVDGPVFATTRPAMWDGSRSARAAVSRPAASDLDRFVDSRRSWALGLRRGEAAVLRISSHR